MTMCEAPSRKIGHASCTCTHVFVMESLQQETIQQTQLSARCKNKTNFVSNSETQDAPRAILKVSSAEMGNKVSWKHHKNATALHEWCTKLAACQKWDTIYMHALLSTCTTCLYNRGWTWPKNKWLNRTKYSSTYTMHRILATQATLFQQWHISAAPDWDFPVTTLRL